MRIYLIAFLIVVWIVWWKWKNSPDEAARRRLVRNSILYGLIGVIFLLAAMGRIHWLGAAFAALFPILKFVFAAQLHLLTHKRLHLSTRRDITNYCQLNYSLQNVCPLLY